jgi:hypothetical protein
MKEYFTIFSACLVILFFVYDYFTKKLSEGSTIRSKAFRFIIYFAAIIAMWQTINNQFDKL